MAIHLESFENGLSLMFRNVVEQRFQEICATHPELLEQRENVVVWQQGIPGNPMETRCVITLNGNEVAKFSVRAETEKTRFTVSASAIEFFSRK